VALTDDQRRALALLVSDERGVTEALICPRPVPIALSSAHSPDGSAPQDRSNRGTVAAIRALRRNIQPKFEPSGAASSSRDAIDAPRLLAKSRAERSHLRYFG